MMTNPAAYLRPRMGHALSMATMRVLPLLQIGLGRRMHHQKPDSGFEMQDAVLPNEADIGMSPPAGSRVVGGKDAGAVFGPDPSQKANLPEARALSSSSEATRPNGAMAARATTPSKPHSSPQGQSVHPVEKGSNILETLAKKRPVQKTTPPSLMATITQASERLSARSLAPMLSSTRVKTSSAPIQDIAVILALKSPLAAVTALRKVGDSPPLATVKPTGAGGSTSPDLAMQPALFDANIHMPTGMADASATHSLASQHLQALVKSLLNPESTTAKPVPAPQEPESADDGFEFEMQLRAALGQILAQDMLRHGLRMPGVF